MKYFLLFTFILFSSCNYFENKSNIYSHPQKIRPKQDDKNIQILLMSLAGFDQGSGPREEIYMTEGSSSAVTLKVGGSEILKQYIDIIKDTFQSELIILSNGGPVPTANMEKKSDIIPKDIKEIPIDVFGLSDFSAFLFHSIGPSELEGFSPSTKFSNANTRTLSNLLKDKKSYEQFSIIEISGLKIGVISLFSYNSSKNAFKEKNNHLYFEGPVLGFIKQRRQLLSKTNVNAMVLIFDSGEDCTLASTTNNRILCPQNGIVDTFLKRIPPNSVDLIVHKGTRPLSGELMNVPFIQVDEANKFFVMAELKFNKETKEFDKDATLLWNPIKQCHEFLKGRNDCFLNPQKKIFQYENSGDTVFHPARFLGAEIKPKDK